MKTINFLPTFLVSCLIGATAAASSSPQTQLESVTFKQRLQHPVGDAESYKPRLIRMNKVLGSFSNNELSLEVLQTKSKQGSFPDFDWEDWEWRETQWAKSKILVKLTKGAGKAYTITIDYRELHQNEDPDYLLYKASVDCSNVVELLNNKDLGINADCVAVDGYRPPGATHMSTHYAYILHLNIPARLDK